MGKVGKRAKIKGENPARAKALIVDNPELRTAMDGLRRSSATSRHTLVSRKGTRTARASRHMAEWR